MPDLGFVRGVITLATLTAFLGICWWAYRPRNRARFEEDALLVFAEDERAPKAAERMGLEEEGDA